MNAEEIRDRFDKQDEAIQAVRAEIAPIRRIVDMALGAWTFLIAALGILAAAWDHIFPKVK